MMTMPRNLQETLNLQGNPMPTTLTDEPSRNLGPLGTLAEHALLADALYRMNHRAAAAEYVRQGLTALMGGGAFRGAPARLLKAWGAPDLAGLFVRMWLKFCIFSTYLAKKKSGPVLRFWSHQEPENPEAPLRFGLLKSLRSAVNHTQTPAAALESLCHADDILQNARSRSALMLGERGTLRHLTVPYDQGFLHVYPDIRNFTSFVLLEQGDWFEDDIHLFRALVRPGDRVLDLGANIGVYAVSAANRVGNDGAVIAVEPSQQTYSLLSRSADCFSNITCVHGAVSNVSRQGLLDTADAPEYAKIGGPGCAGESVRILTVDDICSRNAMDHVDLIKMDVEGHELPALEGAYRTLRDSNPIVFYEINEVGKLHVEVVDLLERLGFKSYAFCLPRRALVPFTKGRKLDRFVINLIAFRPQSVDRFQGIAEIEGITS
jgi:FkbM family methyltransferase